MLHIGIVACSTEGAALCYRTISLEGAQMLGRHDHPEISLQSYSLARYMKHIERDDWAGVAQLMLSSADNLARAGADFLICLTRAIGKRQERPEADLTSWANPARNCKSIALATSRGDSIR